MADHLKCVLLIIAITFASQGANAQDNSRLAGRYYDGPRDESGALETIGFNYRF